MSENCISATCPLPRIALSSTLRVDTLMAICRCILNLAVASAISIPLVLADDLERASHLIRPVIHARDEDKLAAMKSASVIVLAQVQDIALFSEAREVEKPPEVGGPMVPVIPLYLAKISAKPLLNIRGDATGIVEFCSWVWASGKHGGARLFNPTPPSVHVLFLKDDSGYLHTVGDYPAYDIEIRARWVQEFVANWKSGYSDGAGLMERIVAIRLKAELDSPRGGRSERLLVEHHRPCRDDQPRFSFRVS